ncbi:MAG: SufE family protein [Solirubrobacterales bacterium]
MTIDQVQDRIIEEMAPLEGWMQVYEYLTGLGRSLSVSQDLRREENLIGGCQSRVWFRWWLENGKVGYQADSDALIVKGIIALLLQVLDGRTPEEIARAELYFLDRTGLRTHLSPARANGLEAIVTLMKEKAATLLATACS